MLQKEQNQIIVTAFNFSSKINVSTIIAKKNLFAEKKFLWMPIVFVWTQFSGATSLTST